MPSLSTFAVAAMALLSSVQAGFYTTYPVGADTVQPGQTINIVWKSDEQAPVLTNVPSYTLKFMTGGNMVQTTVSTIGTFPISQTTIPFTIPQTAPGMYFLMYTASDGSGSSWSTRFSVGGGTTWYPEGVATGVDPGTSNTNIGEPTVITRPPRTTTTTTATGGSSNTAGSSETSKPTSVDDSSSGNSSPSDTDGSSSEADTDAGNQSSDDSSPQVTSQQTSVTKSSTASGSSGTEEDGAVTDTTDTADTADTADEGNSEEDSQAEEDTESSESSEDEESSTKSSGAAFRYLSAAAVLVASAFMI
ncbi:hypothetical protein GGI07_001794 [Coemansia sp. Benny D115]|nr:hypothetical protein GGI07_001794 [Coemansia sp. Benny D115]